MTVTRRQAREWAIQMLTAADLNPAASAEETIESFWDQLRTLETDEGGNGGMVPRGKMKTFVEERVIGVINNRESIDAELTPLLVEWDLYRLGTVERAVLRMGLWEIANSDVPTNIVINEAVDLVNWFSSPKSRTLVNAVLDKFAKSR